MGARAAVVVSLVGARTRRLSGHEERTEYQQPQGHTVQTGGAPLFFSPCRKLQRCGPGEMGTTRTTTMGLQASRATSPNRDLSLWAGHPEVCLRRVDLRRAQSAKMNYHPFRALLTKKIRDGTFPALSGRVNRHFQSCALASKSTKYSESHERPRTRCVKTVTGRVPCYRP